MKALWSGSVDNSPLTSTLRREHLLLFESIDIGLRRTERAELLVGLRCEWEPWYSCTWYYSGPWDNPRSKVKYGFLHLWKFYNLTSILMGVYIIRVWERPWAIWSILWKRIKTGVTDILLLSNPSSTFFNHLPIHHEDFKCLCLCHSFTVSIWYRGAICPFIVCDTTTRVSVRGGKSSFRCSWGHNIHRNSNWWDELTRQADSFAFGGSCEFYNTPSNTLKC